MDLMNKNILVIGIAKSGIAAGKLCQRLGAAVTLYDSKDREELAAEASLLEAEGFKLIFKDILREQWQKQDLIIMSPGVPTDLPFLQEARNQQIPIWGEVELAFRYCKIPVIAITGTNGKTTTTTLVGEIFKKYRPYTYVVGNIGIPFSEQVLEMDPQGIVIAEASSFQLETIKTFHPHVSAVLNITPDHLNRHKTLEQYIEAKEKIFMNQNSNDFIVLNADDYHCMMMEEKTKAKPIFFSMEKAIKDGVYLKEDQIMIHWKENTREICKINELQILGRHNVENTMAAIAIALAMNVNIEIIQEGILSFRGVAHRIEYVLEIDQVSYYNDSKGTNPDAAIQAINSMNRPIVLIGGGMDKGSDFTKWIQSFNGKVRHLIVFGETADQIQRTAKKEGFFSMTRVKDLVEATKLAHTIATPGDCVLLSPACASWDMFRSYEERGDLFKQVVRNLKGGENEEVQI
ncbi:MAG: UDP-N-acetylmuramoyl-L-alanine--D-glutamate ligase [Epulopiscium sp.]|nr:UDP-N-acetylmuramoyl-L-alanine--D-glutamate ligase [Candidatus Epulonipiscium sp.]